MVYHARSGVREMTRKIEIPDTEYVVLVHSNGHLIISLKEIPVCHIQFKKDSTDDEIIQAAKYCLKIK